MRKLTNKKGDDASCQQQLLTLSSHGLNDFSQMIDMTNTVLQVGTGVVVIVIVWIAALVVGTILLRADGSGK